MSLIGLLIAVVILAVVWWFLSQLPMAQPFRMVALAICVVILILLLVGGLGGSLNIGHVRL